MNGISRASGDRGSRAVRILWPSLVVALTLLALQTGLRLSLTADSARAQEAPSMQMVDPPPERFSNPRTMDPDAFGYVYRESRGEGGVDLPWVSDVRGAGGVILDMVANDSYRAGLPIGFRFPFYGYGYDSFSLTTNGVIGFGAPRGEIYTPRSDRLPSPRLGGAAIAGFWDDLNPSSNKQIAYRLFGAAPDRRLVVEYLTDRYYDRICAYPANLLLRRYQCSDDSRTYFAFQVILHEDGRVVIQYRNLTGDPVDRGQAAIGIQNETASIGLGYAFHEAIVRDGLAVEFDRPYGLPTVPYSVAPPIALAELKGCQDQTVGGFRKLLQTNSTVRARIGCPRRAEAPLDAVQQPFEGGQMLYRVDTREVLVTFVDQSRWASFIDTYQGEDESELTPPEGRVVPVLGFGKIWRQSAGLRQRIGWPLVAERPFSGFVQAFENGTMIWTGQEQWLIRVYFSDGTVLETADPNRPE